MPNYAFIQIFNSFTFFSFSNYTISFLYFSILRDKMSFIFNLWHYDNFVRDSNHEIQNHKNLFIFFHFRMIVEVSKAVALLSNGYIIKLLKSRECPPNHRRRQQQPPQQQQNTNQQTSSWPIIFDIDDAPSLSFARNKLLNNRLSAERIEERSATTSTCYLVCKFLFKNSFNKVCFFVTYKYP